MAKQHRRAPSRKCRAPSRRRSRGSTTDEFCGHVAERAEVCAHEHGSSEPEKEARAATKTGPAQARNQARNVDSSKGKAMVDLIGLFLELLAEFLAVLLDSGSVVKPRRSNGLGLV